MSFKTRSGWMILCILFSQIPHSFSGEIYRWIDEKGTIHFTDDESRIPRQYSDQADKIEFKEKGLKEVEEIEKTDEIPDRVKDYLEDMEEKIEMKKNMEKKISELEEELKSCEERLKRIEEYEKEDYYNYQPFRDRRTGKWVPVSSPYYHEKVNLKGRIDAIQIEVKKIQEKLSQLMRSL